MIAWICDDEIWQATNRLGRNYWDVYIREIMNWQGIRAQAWPLAALEDIRQLGRIRTLAIGRLAGSRLTEPMKSNLDAWVRAGGTLIGFAVQGLDSVFGIESADSIRQMPDDYSISGYFSLQAHPLTTDIHSSLCPEQPLLILSDIMRVRAVQSQAIARLLESGASSPYAAVTWRELGKGHAAYFAFDVAQTIWVIHQGRPLNGVPANEPYERTGDMQVMGANSRQVAYADEILLVLQNMLARHPHVFLHQLPPAGDTVADALLFWGGDGCGTRQTDILVQASDFMKANALPYHINVIYHRDQLWLTPEEARRIVTNGHEISIHYNFADTMPRISAEHIKLQNDLFFEKYGIRPCCSVNHCLCWTGWAEPAKWMAACDGRADNTFGGMNLPLTHPNANGPCFGFGFGTTFPFNFYDGWQGGNQRIEFLEEPIAAYELGHRMSLRDAETKLPEEVHAPIDYALKYHATLNMFYHGVYLAQSPGAREAVQETLRYIREKNATIVHMANDQLWRWWDTRANMKLSETIADRNSTRLEYECGYPGGIVIKIPLRTDSVIRLTCDGNILQTQTRREFGTTWAYAVAPSGAHVIEGTFE
ncbi:MAG: hypothetical protein PHW60_05270 [Kiritimatiellae bacterium]|nr:hypothetical protein [Kiritimatiellia bacterium]